PRKGHRGAVLAAAYCSDDGRRVVTAGRDGMLQVWSSSTGHQAWSMKGHEGWVKCLAATRDGEWLASGGQDGTVRLWRVEAWQQERVFPGKRDWIRRIALAPAGKPWAGVRLGGTVGRPAVAPGDEERRLWAARGVG